MNFPIDEKVRTFFIATLKNYLFSLLNLKKIHFNFVNNSEKDYPLNKSKNLFIIILDDQIKLFLILLDFIQEFKFFELENNSLLFIKDFKDLKEIENLKNNIQEEINYNFYNNLKNKNVINLFKTCVKYNNDMLKLKNNFYRENKIDFEYLFLGPDFLVSSKQPALGMVYKLMEINKSPCIKFSEEKGKQTIPGSKCVFRLFDSENKIIGDYMNLVSDNENLEGKKTVDAL